MKAMQLVATGAMTPESDPLEAVDLPIPEPGPGEIRIRVAVCGVCHTELDEIEGRTAPPALPVVPGHEIIGRVDAVGEGVTLHAPGNRVGVGWIHSSTGEADENLSPAFEATGRDVNGGYAEYMTVPERYAFPVPEVFSDIEAAPLLCAGAVGYRALRLAGLTDGEALGLTGFGGSAHLVIQIANHLYPASPVAVFARDPAQTEQALALGADWSGSTEARAPFGLDAIIDTTPAWLPVVEALANLRPGGRLVINAIRKEDGDMDALLKIRYETHLWQEKSIRSVANVTGADIAEFLPLAAEVPLRPEVEVYPFERANDALRDLRFGAIRGARVLDLGGPDRDEPSA
jgi:propanol-preferring alcohol dehydrogenase